MAVKLSAGARIALAGVTFALSSACTGDLGDPGEEGSLSGEPGGSVLSCTELQGLPVAMRRLTKLQYEHTIGDLFGGIVAPSSHFPGSDPAFGFSTYAEANTVSQLGADRLLQAAEEVAAEAVDQLESWSPCSPSGDSACAEELIRELGARAFRRPIRDEEVTALMGVYAGVVSPEFSIRIAAVLATILQAPQFLYLVEEGEGPPDEASRVELSSYEIASRLSYLLWNTMPDDELLAAAADGRLSTSEGVLAEAERLLSNRERSAPALVRFYREWVGVDAFLETTTKDPGLYPEFEATKASMSAELDRFIEEILWGDATLERLLTSVDTWVDADLATFYGVAAPEAGQWSPASVPDRPGLLARPAVMATYASFDSANFIKRGKMVRTQMLCDSLPPPPPEAQTFEFPEGLTVRERSELLMTDQACATCHTLINPAGLAFEGFDASGAAMGVDASGAPLDLSGELVGAGDASGAFGDASDLMQQLAQSDKVKECVIEKWQSYQTGRDQAKHDACTLDELEMAFDESGGNLYDLVLAIVSTSGFRVRLVDVQEQ